jgi:hypothetical protein
VSDFVGDRDSFPSPDIKYYWFQVNLNVVSLQIKEAIYHIYLPTPAVFWCFMHIATASYYDPKRGLGLTKEVLQDAWKDFTVPGNFGFQCLRQIL